MRIIYDADYDYYENLMRKLSEVGRRFYVVFNCFFFFLLTINLINVTNMIYEKILIKTVGGEGGNDDRDQDRDRNSNRPSTRPDYMGNGGNRPPYAGKCTQHIFFCLLFAL